MKSRRAGLAALYTLCFMAIAIAVHADVAVVMGNSWTGPSDRLQRIVDATYGPGHIRVATDYVGARAGDADPFVWLTSVGPILQVREIAGHAHRGDLGWYIESGATPPVIDGLDDGPVFTNLDVEPPTAVLHFGSRGRPVGFFLRSADAGSGQGPRTFFTNRSLNDLGPGGGGALHEPGQGGDVQALIFDVSCCTRSRTWLVCFEDRDSGALPGPCCATTDNDYADYVFEVRAEAPTPVAPTSFGSLKIHYR